MLSRSSIGAIALAATLCAAVADAHAFDESKKGQAPPDLRYFKKTQK